MTDKWTKKTEPGDKAPKPPCPEATPEVTKKHPINCPLTPYPGVTGHER